MSNPALYQNLKSHKNFKWRWCGGGECLELFCIFIATAWSRSFDERGAVKGEAQRERKRKGKTSAIPSDLFGAAQELFISYWLDTLVDWAANTNKSLSGASRNNPFIKVGCSLLLSRAALQRKINSHRAASMKKGKFDPSSMAPRAAPNLFRNKAGEHHHFGGGQNRWGRINFFQSASKLILWSIQIAIKFSRRFRQENSDDIFAHTSEMERRTIF